MYSSEYEDEQINNNSNNSFYQNNKKLVWIFIAIILIVIIVVILKNKMGSSTVNPVNDVSVMIYPEAEISISPGNTYKLIAVVNNNPNATVTWSSSNEDILKVDGGVVTGIDYGKATVTASYIHSDNNKYEMLKEIIVADGKVGVEVTEISIKDGELIMPVDGTYTIGLNVVPSKGYITSKVFKSSNENVVVVDNKGNVKAIGEGEATITININNGTFNKELKVFVSKDYSSSEIVVSPTKIVLNKESTKIKVGGTVKLSYTVVPSEARGSNLIWTSSDASVLTVDNGGIITALKEGKVTIKLASLNGINDTLDIEVIPDAVPVTEISLSLSDIYLEAGQSQTITPVVIPDTATDKTLTYTSSDENIIKVESTNEGTSCSITGVSSGTATLTIKANSSDVTKEVSVIVGDSTPIDPGSSGYSGGGGGSCNKTCPAGQYLSGCTCKDCPANSYCNNNKKNACPSGATSPAKSTSASACKRSCPAGQGYDVGTNKCVNCASGYVSPAGSTSCTKCTGNTVPNDARSSCVKSSATTVTCAANQYKVGTTCYTCTAGYMCNGTSRTRCGAGYISGKGATTCTKCKSGKSDASRTKCTN